MLTLERQALDCVASRQPVIGKRHSFTMDGDTLLLHLASGRAVSYPNARIEIGERGKPVVIYHDASGDMEELWYGALLAHLISGTARDLLANALLNLDVAGFDIVLHVHDEVVAEADADKVDLDLFKHCMLDAPAWAAGLPLATKVRASDRYIKIEEPAAESGDDIVEGQAVGLTSIQPQDGCLEDVSPDFPVSDSPSGAGGHPGDAENDDGNERAEPHPMLAAALGYVMREDWDVFPAPPGAKKSHKAAEYSSGAKWGRTKDLAEIRRDWQKWPDANIGIPDRQGQRDLRGRDRHQGRSRRRRPCRHEATGGRARPTSRYADGGEPIGFDHRYFKHPGGEVEIKNSVSEIAPGVDVRGDGGMVIAPPSVRKDGTYRWLNDLPMADAPGWLIELVKKKPRTGSSGDGQPTSRQRAGPRPTPASWQRPWQ